jgi:hypothetical protein
MQSKGMVLCCAFNSPSTIAVKVTVAVESVGLGLRRPLCTHSWHGLELAHASQRYLTQHFVSAVLLQGTQGFRIGTYSPGQHHNTKLHLNVFCVACD